MDNRGRKLGRDLKHNDNPTAALAHGARTGDVDLVVNSLQGVLGNIPLNQQRRVMQKIADIVASSTKTDRDGQVKPIGATKAFEIHGPELGKITLEELVATISNTVVDAISGVDNELISYKKSTGWSHRMLGRPELKKHIAKVFENWSGSFVVSCSSPIRVYALHEAPSEEEKARRKKEKELRGAQEKLQKKREALDKATAREKKLKAELAKLARDEERYKKSIEKAEKEFDALNDV
jgi:hypothetical protein